MIGTRYYFSLKKTILINNTLPKTQVHSLYNTWQASCDV